MSSLVQAYEKVDIEVGSGVSEWAIGTVSRAALERTINSFATDLDAVLAGLKLISSNSERWRHKDRHRHHKLQNVNVLADTKAILLARQVITRVYSTKRSAHSPRSTLLFRRLWGLATWSHCLAL
jgi:hypothetical protein